MTGRQWHFGQRDTLVDALLRAVEQWPDAIYLDACDGVLHSFAEFDRLTNRYAHGLAAAGVSQGSLVGTMLGNSADCLAVIFAVMKLGAILVPLNISLKGEFLRHQLADSTATILLCEAEFVDRVTAVHDQLPGLASVFVRGSAAVNLADSRVRNFSELHSGNSSGFETRPRPADLCMLLYTSGTTGLSKACMISHNYLAHYVRDLQVIGALTPDEILYTPAPLFHIGSMGMALTGPVCGNRVVLDQRFSVSGYWREVRRSRASVISVIGAMVPLLAQAEDTEDSRACFGQVRRHYGMPFSPDIAKIWRERFGLARAHNTGFGMSEASMIFLAPADTDVPDGSSGRSSPDFDCRILDEDGNECPAGVAGELAIRPLSPNIMFEGYWKHPEATVQAWKHLWFHTGDIGRIDGDGFFYFVDRKKDYIRRRGENISTYEMEAVFMKHPAVAEVVVHAVPSELAEDDVKVTAVLVPGAALTEEELCRWSVDKVPYFAVPRYIEFRQSLPYNASGKALKFILREEGRTPTTWDREVTEFELKKH